MLEQSLILIKPDAMKRGLACTILGRLEGQGFKLLAMKMLHMDRSFAERHYAVHKDKPFFKGLIEYITSAPIVAAVFEGENAIAELRKAMGSTDPAKAAKGTIRGDFGLNIEHNSIHGSDSVETAEKEIRLFFAGAEIHSY